MLRRPGGSCRIAPMLLAALLAPAPVLAQVELSLPSPSGATTLVVIAAKADLSPRPDGAFEALVSLTVLNPGQEAEDLVLRPGEPAGVVTRAGESVRLQEDGSSKLRLEPSEVAVLRVRSRVAPSQRPFLTAESSGWSGPVRGALLQPVHLLRIAHPDGSPWSATALEVAIDPGGGLLASSLVATPGALARTNGSVSWSFSAGQGPGSVGLAWPVVETETLLPSTAGEAESFASYWTGERGLEVGAARLVRLALFAIHGSVPEDAESRQALSPERRPGWAVTSAPPSAAELEAARVIEDLEALLGDAAAPRVAAVQPSPPRPSPEPERRPAAEAEPVGPAGPRPPALPPPGPAPRRERAAAAPAPAPDLSRADADPLVTIATEESWREEGLLETESSVPRTPESARRWARRALRGGHGLSRVVLARESLLALHGKTWSPGYVADFFGSKPWYRPDPDFRMERLSADERLAHEILDELVSVVSGGRELDPAPRTGVPVAAARPTEPRPGPERAPPRDEPGPRAVARPAPDVAPIRPAPRAPSALPDDVPWLHDAAQARIFLFRERARGLRPERVGLAIATIEARHGKAFDSEPDYRRHFEGRAWYRPRLDFGPEQLSIPAREAITLLRNALDARTN